MIKQSPEHDLKLLLYFFGKGMKMTIYDFIHENEEKFAIERGIVEFYDSKINGFSIIIFRGAVMITDTADEKIDEFYDTLNLSEKYIKNLSKLLFNEGG